MSVFYVPAEPRPLCLVLSDDRTLPLRAAAVVGVTLLPWQRQYLLAVLNGEQVVMHRGRRIGWTTVQRVGRELEKWANEEAK